MSIEMIRPEWYKQAECKGATYLFFPVSPESPAARVSREQRAAEICGRCLVKKECLDYAEQGSEPWGVWGGEVFVGGVPLSIKQTRRGSARKVQ